jgi:hypothetical protein
LLKNILNIKTLRTVYLVLVQSIISYGIVIWGNASKFALNPLIITLNSLLRFILLKPYDFHVDDLYNTFNVRNLNGLYIWNILNYIFNSDLKNNYPSHRYQTRLKKSVNLNMPVIHKEFGRKMVINVGIRLCIVLNINLKSYKNKYHYKKYLKHLNLNHIIL